MQQKQHVQPGGIKFYINFVQYVDKLAFKHKYNLANNITLRQSSHVLTQHASTNVSVHQFLSSSQIPSDIPTLYLINKNNTEADVTKIIKPEYMSHVSFCNH